MLLSTDATKWGFGQVGSEFHSHERREDLRQPLWIITFRYEKLGAAAIIKLSKYEQVKDAWILRTKFHGRISKPLELDWVMNAVGVERPQQSLIDPKTES